MPTLSSQSFISTSASGLMGFAFMGSRTEAMGWSRKSENDDDIERLESEISDMEDSLEDDENVAVKKALAEKYIELGVRFQSEDELDEAIDAFDSAISLLQPLWKTQYAAEKNDNSPEAETTQRMYGQALLSQAISFDDLGDFDEAIDLYKEAAEILSPLANSGDGDAKYDLAGIQLNLGNVYHEMMDFEKAKKEMEASFLAFRALEKISDLDTRYFMGKCSVSQGHLARDMEEPLSVIVDLYNRAMRLFVELIDGGDMSMERDLAMALFYKCVARFDAGERESVLKDVQQAVDILRRLFEKEASVDSLSDFFEVQSTVGAMNIDLGKPQEAIVIFDNIVEILTENGNAIIPENLALAELLATTHGNRSDAYKELEKYDDAMKCITQAIEIRESHDTTEMDEEEIVLVTASLVGNLCERATLSVKLGNKAAAKSDCKKAAERLAPLADELGDLYEDLAEEIKKIDV